MVFVSAYDDRAVDAFELGVPDYVRKPVQAERLAESLRRVAGARLAPSHPAVAGRRDRVEEPTIPVELAGVTKLLPRSSVRWVEAQGDYARLHTADAFAPGPGVPGDAGRALGGCRFCSDPPLVPRPTPAHHRAAADSTAAMW